MMPWTLRVLGSVTVQQDGDPVASSRLSQPRHVALLCYLVLARPRGLHARDALIAMLWPEHDQLRGRRALRNALHGLRQLLGTSAIISVGDGLVGVDPAYVRCDALELEARIGGIATEIPELHAEPFHGLHVSAAVGFEHWMAAERERLRALLHRVRRQDVVSVEAVPPTRPAWRASPHSPDAYAMYVRGHYLFLRAAPGGAPAELLQSRECFERALSLDPQFAPALAGLSNFFAVAARRGILTPFHSTFARAIEYSHRALAIDAGLAIPHVHFGVQALYLDDDWDQAGREFATAVALEPDYAEGHRFYGVWLGLMNRHAEALEAMEAAALLEPDIPHMLSSLAAARVAVGDHTGAEQVMLRTLALDPRHAPTRERLLRLLEAQARYAEAVALRETHPAALHASEFAEAWRSAGASGYEAARTRELEDEAARLESRLLESHESSPNDLFAPPVVRLVAVYAKLNAWKRARSWQLQACAARPVMARWFASIPELPSGSRPDAPH